MADEAGVAAAWCAAFAAMALFGCGQRDPRRAEVGPRDARHAEVGQHMWDRHGDPSLNGWVIPDGSRGEVLGWRVCPPGRSCGALVRAGSAFEPGATAPGTRFELRVSYRGQQGRTRSRAWLGRLQAIAPPTLEGTVAVGATVRARPARWRGGWRERGAFSELRIEACRTPKPVECETLAAPAELSGSEPEAVIGGYYAGWYVQAIDWRHAEDTMFTLPAYADALAVPPVRRFGGGVAVSAPVRVPGPPADVPRVKLRNRAVLDRARLVIGEVRCARCSVKLVGAVGRTEFQQTVRVSGKAALRLKRAIRHPRASVSVRVLFDGRRMAVGTVLGRP